MRVIYDDTEGLTNLINEVYFGDNNGKIPEEFDQKLKLETSVLKTILSDLQGCEIKVENEIIDGSMKFETKEDGEDLYLVPISIYCVKKDEDKEIYSFY
jgi:hypothetical protein